MLLDIVVRSKGLIGIVVSAEVDIVVAMLDSVGIDRSLPMVGTTEMTVVAGIGSKLVCSMVD